MFDIQTWLPFLLAKSHQQAFYLMKTEVMEFNLTPPQFASLAFLWQQDGINLQELGMMMCVDRTTIGGIVDRLEKLGYVKRVEDPVDKRSSLIYITDKGFTAKVQLLTSLDRVQEEIDLRLSTSEQALLKELLTKFRG